MPVNNKTELTYSDVSTELLDESSESSSGIGTQSQLSTGTSSGIGTQSQLSTGTSSGIGTQSQALNMSGIDAPQGLPSDPTQLITLTTTIIICNCLTTTWNITFTTIAWGNRSTTWVAN